MDSMYDDILYEAADGVATITLNRPDKLNALRVETYEELASALREAGADASVGVVVLAGAGRAFCAGGDLEMAQTVLTTEHAGRQHYFGRMITVSDLVLNLEKPVVCAIRGACVGGGAELVTFADFAVAGDSAYFVFNGTALGGCSWWGGPQLLPLQVGLRRAEEILYLSEKVGADEAARIGLVNRTVPDDDVASETQAICSRILDLSENGVRLTKSALRTAKQGLLASMSGAAEANAAALGRPDLHAAFDAFLNGRDVSWRALRAGV
jgi:enoyl-CoA hydratase/carnithine racemase